MRIMRRQTDWYRDGRVWRNREHWQNLMFRIFRNMRAEWRPTTRRPLVSRVELPTWAETEAEMRAAGKCLQCYGDGHMAPGDTCDACRGTGEAQTKGLTR